MTPCPKYVQLWFPSAVYERVVHVHGDDANLLGGVADARVQLDFRHHASVETVSRLPLRRNCGTALPLVETYTPRRRQRISPFQNALLPRHTGGILEANARCA